MSSIEGLQFIANDISTGFEVLLDRLHAQRRVEQDLRQQLADAAERFNACTSDNPSDGALSAWQDEIVKQISPKYITDGARNYSAISEVETAKRAIASLKINMPPPNMPKCPVAHGYSDIREEMEKDFTVPGKPSKLECPFVTTSKTTPLDTLGRIDPIAAEFHQDSLSARSVDEARSCGRCPIRFLDKHSPEEIAQYFENHKHEIPRSHEICVKRYQQNESSIRKLDAKYGNIVSMIQGLGSKHKQYLPNERPDSANVTDQKSGEVVEIWANQISKQTVQEPAETPSEQRQSHFDKPLREIRVGESPTRPWGISIPVDRSAAPSAAQSQQGSKTSSKNAKARAGDKPTVLPNSSAIDSASLTSRSHTSSRKSRRSHAPKITINGPVFFGYSAEQTATFLQQLGFTNKT